MNYPPPDDDPWPLTSMLIPPILTFICRHPWLRHPALVALLVVLALRRLGPRRDGQRRFVALLMPRPGLAEDALSALGNAPEFSLFILPRGIMKAIATTFLPETIDDNNYFGLSAEEEEAKAKYRTFLCRVLPILAKLCRIDVIISGNFAYFAERELHAAAEACNLPFVVLHKENLKSPARREYFEHLYRSKRGPFTGRRIIVYNGFEKQIQVAANVVRPDQVTVCGMARLDRAHAWRRAVAGVSSNSPPTILFFSFGAKTGLPVLRRKLEQSATELLDPELERLTLEDTARLTVEALVAFARSNPCVQLVVKAKARGGSQIDDFRRACGNALPPNVELVRGGDPMPWLQRAWAVVGLNSTALLEALAMGKTVLAPVYGEAGRPEMQPWLADFAPVVERVKSPRELMARLSQLCDGEPPIVPVNLAPPVEAVLEGWGGNADGQAGERVRAALTADILRSSHEAQTGLPVARRSG